ncbi:hypothetical protein DN36_3305 [Vibrio cholerae]|nr:hypothetical protein DN36_3305 [Vibrio cholerae]
MHSFQTTLESEVSIEILAAAIFDEDIDSQFVQHEFVQGELLVIKKLFNSIKFYHRLTSHCLTQPIFHRLLRAWGT